MEHAKKLEGLIRNTLEQKFGAGYYALTLDRGLYTLAYFNHRLSVVPCLKLDELVGLVDKLPSRGKEAGI